MLVDVAATDHAVGALGHERDRILQNLAQVLAADAAYQYRRPYGLDDPVEIPGVLCRIGLNDVGVHLERTDDRLVGILQH